MIEYFVIYHDPFTEIYYGEKGFDSEYTMEIAKHFSYEEVVKVAKTSSYCSVEQCPFI